MARFTFNNAGRRRGGAQRDQNGNLGPGATASPANTTTAPMSAGHDWSAFDSHFGPKGTSAPKPSTGLAYPPPVTRPGDDVTHTIKLQKDPKDFINPRATGKETAGQLAALDANAKASAAPAGEKIMTAQDVRDHNARDAFTPRSSPEVVTSAGDRNRIAATYQSDASKNVATGAAVGNALLAKDVVASRPNRIPGLPPRPAAPGAPVTIAKPVAEEPTGANAAGLAVRKAGASVGPAIGKGGDATATGLNTAAAGAIDAGNQAVGAAGDFVSGLRGKTPGQHAAEVKASGAAQEKAVDAFTSTRPAVTLPTPLAAATGTPPVPAGTPSPLANTAVPAVNLMALRQQQQRTQGADPFSPSSTASMGPNASTSMQPADPFRTTVQPKVTSGAPPTPSTPPPASGQPAAATAPVDHTALAQQALTDPEATDEHRRAARQILGQ